MLLYNKKKQQLNEQKIFQLFKPDSCAIGSETWLADDDTDIEACLARSIASRGLSSK